MDKEAFKFVIEKTEELSQIPYVYKGLKEKAAAFLKSCGTAGEGEALKEYFSELEADIMPIETAIAFAESEKGKEILGADRASAVAAHSRARQAAGEKYCGCEACVKAAQILEKKSLIF